LCLSVFFGWSGLCSAIYIVFDGCLNRWCGYGLCVKLGMTHTRIHTHTHTHSSYFWLFEEIAMAIVCSACLWKVVVLLWCLHKLGCVNHFGVRVREMGVDVLRYSPLHIHTQMFLSRQDTPSVTHPHPFLSPSHQSDLHSQAYER
jgi:hypothetical protein